MQFVVLLLCLLATPSCTGYKPFKGNTLDESTAPEPIDPDNPPPEHGRSVYDPEIINKFKCMQFSDQITEEEVEEEEREKSPHMPSYPWRGGGHVPMPLDDPDEDMKKTEEKIDLIGFMDCDELLGLLHSNQLLTEEEEEEKEERMTLESETEMPHTFSEQIEVEEDEEQNPEDTESCEDDHESNNTDSSKCSTCDSSTELKSFVFRGVGAVNVFPLVSADYKHDALHSQQDSQRKVDNEKSDDGEGEEDYSDVYNDAGDFGSGFAQEDGQEEPQSDTDVLVIDAGEGVRTPIDGGKDAPALFLDEDEDDFMEIWRQSKKLNPNVCRVCMPCCNYLGELGEGRRAQGVGRRYSKDECALDAQEEEEFISAECRTCSVLRRPPRLGVILTCYDCARQQADRTCRLGVHNQETSQYRVSPRFFVTIDTNDSSPTTATQHSSLTKFQNRMAQLSLEALLMQAQHPSSSQGQYQKGVKFIDTSDEDFYPFETEEYEEMEEGDEEPEEAEEGVAKEDKEDKGAEKAENEEKREKYRNGKKEEGETYNKGEKEEKVGKYNKGEKEEKGGKYNKGEKEEKGGKYNKVEKEEKEENGEIYSKGANGEKYKRVKKERVTI